MIQKQIIAIGVAGFITLSSFAPLINFKDAKTESPVYEIAVRKVKDGMKSDFESARTVFIKNLIAQKGVSNDREFQSFYSLPQPDKQEVFIGMTEYKDLQTVGALQQNPTIGASFMDFAKTMDLKAYAFVQPIEGGVFDLSTLAKKQGQVLEVAIRKVKSGQEEAFQKMRKAFVEKLGKEDGVVKSWEFKVVGGQNTDGLTVGMTVYENQEKFQKIGQATQTWKESAFFGTFEPVALQYAVSIK